MGFGQWIEVGRMDELGRMDTPVHRIDARVKSVTTIIFIIIVMSFPRYAVSALTQFLFYPLMLILLGRIPLGFIFRKILIAAPFALVIGIFNPFFDRQAAVIIGPWVISGGWLSFASIMLRFVLTVGAALTLVACTGMNRLGASLEQMGLPRIFVVQLLLLYRYLFVITDEGTRMMRSLELRSAGLPTPGLRVYGALAGHLLLRSMARAERVYRAMIARGFSTGGPRFAGALRRGESAGGGSGAIMVMRRTSLQWTDWAFLIGWTAFFVAARAWNLADWIGSLLI